MSYELIIAKIESIRPIEGADRIIAATILGNEVVLGKTSQVGDILCYAETDGIFEDAFCEANGLFPVLDENGKKIGGGFFERGKARVRAQKFKGCKSNGFAFPLSYLNYTGYDLSKLKVGDRFSELNDVKIAQKYFTPATLRAQANKNKQGKKQPKTLSFPEHVDSSKFQYDMMEIKKGDLITTTVKMHGTSNRLGKTFIQKALPKWKEFINKLYPLFTAKVELDYLVGTRRVILDASKPGISYYGNEEFRYKHLELIKALLEPGEVIMGELVGYTTSGAKIMPDHLTADTKDKEYIKQYGDKISYTYSCLEGQCEFYAYRILKCDQLGNSIDLTWPQVKKRCEQLGLKYVVQCADSFVFDGDYDKLKTFVAANEVGPDPIDNRIHREGIVLRVDNGNKTPLFIKQKNWFFGVQEGYLKNNAAYVDTEEAS